jgi:hypothetical protein
MSNDDLLKSLKAKIDLASRGRVNTLSLSVTDVRRLIEIIEEKPKIITKETIIEVDSNKYRGNIDLGKF